MSMTNDSAVKPSVVIGANSRFATTFLSTKYRDKAVAGEVLMDKTTGEIYIKRVSDGKIVSFYQNKKKINDLSLDLRVTLLNNKTFEYPRYSETAFYISTNYDLVSIHNEVLYNLTTDNIEIGGPDTINQLIFNLSSDTNGFFCLCCTRDSDKSVVEYLTDHYNRVIKNYTGEDEEYLIEKEKFDNTRWENSSARIVYDVTIVKDGVEYTYSDLTDYIQLNNNSCVLFPEVVYSEVESFDSAVVTIKSINFDKIHFLFNHEPDLMENISNLIAHDKRIEIAELNISHFINDISDIVILGNEVVVALLTTKHITDYMRQMSKLIEPESPVIIDKHQPLHKCLWFKPV